MKIIKINIKITLLMLLLILVSSAFARTVTNWKALPVTKYWTRKAVIQENGKKHFFYRPVRFEKMPVDISGCETLVLKSVTKKKSEKLVVTVAVDGVKKDYTLDFTHSDRDFHFYQNQEIVIPKGGKELLISTRNPWAYFRAYSKQTKEIKPVRLVMQASGFKRIVNLFSGKSNRSYYVGDKSSSIKFTATRNGKIKALFRFLPIAKKQPCKVEIYVNGELKQTLEMKHKLSGTFKVNDMKVSVGKVFLLSKIKKNDQIEIKTLTNHEILTRWYLTTE